MSYYEVPPAACYLCGSELDENGNCPTDTIEDDE